jgi:hypothetical protein
MDETNVLFALDKGDDGPMVLKKLVWGLSERVLKVVVLFVAVLLMRVLFPQRVWNRYGRAEALSDRRLTRRRVDIQSRCSKECMDKQDRKGNWAMSETSTIRWSVIIS